jgi:hypothetical protein
MSDEERQKDPKEWDKSYEEFQRIDWSEPTEENGLYPHGTAGAASWTDERKRRAVDVIAGRIVQEYPYLELPDDNPFPEYLAPDQWQEVRGRITKSYHARAERLLEDAFRQAKFLEGKDLEAAARVAGRGYKFFHNSRAEALREYLEAARDGAEVFHRLAVTLEWLRLVAKLDTDMDEVGEEVDKHG